MYGLFSPAFSFKPKEAKNKANHSNRWGNYRETLRFMSTEGMRELMAQVILRGVLKAAPYVADGVRDFLDSGVIEGRGIDA